MATWSSFEKDRLLAENWRKFVKDNPEDKSSQTVFGINSEDNPESLKSFLKKNQGAIGLTPEKVDRLVALMLAQTKEDDVVLEAIGGPQRDARTFSSETTTKLNTLIDSFDLGAANKKKLEKVLNRWAKLNTVSFEQGAASAPVPTPAEPPPTEKPDEAEAETDRIEPVSSTRPTKKPDEKTPAQTAVDLLNKVDTPVSPSTKESAEQVSLKLFNSFVRDFKSFIRKSIARQKKLEEISKAQLAKKFGLSTGKKFDTFFNNNKKYTAIRSRLTFMSMDALKSFLKAFEQVAKSLSADTPAEPEAPTPDTSAEPTPEPEAASPEPEVNREPESEQEEAESDPTKELESYIEKVKENINKYNVPDYKSFVLPTSIDIIKEFRIKYLKLAEKQLKNEQNSADLLFSDEIGYLVNKLENKYDTNKTKIEYIDFYIKRMKNAEDDMTFKNALNIFKKVVEPVKEFLLSQTNPEPAGEEGGKDETPKPSPKRKKKTAPPIKDQEAYDHGKQGKAIGSKGTLRTNPVQDIEKAISGLTRIKSTSDNQNFRDKIDSYIRGLYDFQDEKETSNKLEESLMLRWKTIAGIK